MKFVDLPSTCKAKCGSILELVLSNRLISNFKVSFEDLEINLNDSTNFACHNESVPVEISVFAFTKKL